MSGNSQSRRWVRNGSSLARYEDCLAHPHSPSPGSGEFLLIDEKKPDEVLLVVRTINTSAFAKEDWNEFPATVRTPPRITECAHLYALSRCRPRGHTTTTPSPRRRGTGRASLARVSGSGADTLCLPTTSGGRLACLPRT